jgi:hypothetical protein
MMIDKTMPKPVKQSKTSQTKNATRSSGVA